MNSSAGLPEAGRRTLDYTLWLTLIRYNYVKLKMEIKVNGACNCDTSDKTGMESMQLHILKWMVCVYVCGGNSGCRAQKKKKKLTRLGFWWGRRDARNSQVALGFFRLLWVNLPWLLIVAVLPSRVFAFCAKRWSQFLLRMPCYANSRKHKWRPSLLCRPYVLCGKWILMPAYSRHKLCALCRTMHREVVPHVWVHCACLHLCVPTWGALCPECCGARESSVQLAGAVLLGLQVINEKRDWMVWSLSYQFGHQLLQEQSKAESS